jgi:hypothetical protein
MGDHYADILEAKIAVYKKDGKKLARKIKELESSLDYNIDALDKAFAKVRELTAKIADQHVPGDTCAVCVHSHALDITADSMVVCTPQGKAHDRGYSCTGFRRTTLKELGEIADARFGKARDV